MIANLTRAEARRRSATLELTDCRIELDLSVAADPGRLTFPTRTTLTLASGVSETFLDFVGESVESLEVNGIAREVAYDGARIPVTGLSATGLDTTGRDVVDVRATARYSRSGEGLHRYVDPVDGATYLYTHAEPADARRVFANLEQPDLKAAFTVVVTAPADWQILSNQAEQAREEAGTDAAGRPLARVTFGPTPPMSTYLVCVAAGPYRRWEDSWTGASPYGEGGRVTVPLSVLCRASLADVFDPENVLAITKAGLDHFQREFALPYPWGKYDSIFVPEYNLGAMENPGLVTFNDTIFVFQSGATRADQEMRANTILHEMSHMWFGDLVTPQWWDDLWLKESLADYLGTDAVARASEFPEAWTTFCARRKAWAYRADQLPTTHPIIADIADVEAAKQNFDGITYAKGAAVVKQLVAYVGHEAFRTGVRRYLSGHAFGSATLDDLLGELEVASGRDLHAWARLWLQTAGVATLTTRVTLAADGTIAGLQVLQAGRDAATGRDCLRPHRITLGLYGERAGAPAAERPGPPAAEPGPAGSRGGLVRLAAYDLDVVGAVTPVPEAVGGPAPALVVVDDTDLTYAKIRLDEASRRTALARLTDLDSSLTRALLWVSLWNDCRDARLSAATYVPFVLAQAPAETDVALLATALENALTAALRFTPDGAARQAQLRAIATVSWDRLREAERGPGQQLAWARAFAAAAMACDARAEEVRRLLSGAEVVEGLRLGPQLRWLLVRGLAATGHADEAYLAQARAADATSLAPVRHRAALASLPTAAAKAAAWDAVTDDPALTNDLLTAVCEGFSTPGQEALRVPYVGPYFAALTGLWAARSQELAQRAVTGLFPRDVPAGSGVDVPAGAQEWLDGQPGAPAALRRTIIELTDETVRSRRAQAAYGETA